MEEVWLSPHVAKVLNIFVVFLFFAGFVLVLRWVRKVNRHVGKDAKE